MKTGPGDQHITTHTTCTEYQKRPGYAPSYTQTQSLEFRAVLVVVADSALRLTQRDTLLRRFVESRGNTYFLSTLAKLVAPEGRWAAVVHSPAR